MISDNVLAELNKQVNEELYSSYLYLSMSAWCEQKNLSGFANWTKIQAQEELAHGMKIYNFINERGGKAVLDTIKAPQSEWDNVVELFEAIYKHEQHISGRINHMTNIAIEEKDHATVNFLQWFISEQVEEEASVSDLLEQIKLVDGKGSGLFMLNRELAQRSFVPISE